MYLFDTEQFVLPEIVLLTMYSQSGFQILLSITIPMVYRLFVFIFRYLSFST